MKAAIEQGVPEIADDVSELYVLHLLARTYGWTQDQIENLGQFTSSSLVELIAVEDLLKSKGNQ